jgi:O-antigen/teichoic acid export membrane protein
MSPEKAFKPMLIAAALNVVLDLALVKSFGVFGICIATVIAQGTALALFGFKVMGWKRLLVFYASTTFVFAAFFLREWGLLVLIPAAAYLVFTRSITKGDMMVVKETFSKSWPGRTGKSV